MENKINLLVVLPETGVGNRGLLLAKIAITKLPRFTLINYHFTWRPRVQKLLKNVLPTRINRHDIIKFPSLSPSDVASLNYDAYESDKVSFGRGYINPYIF